MARINAVATVEAAQIRAAQPPMVPSPQPAGLVQAVSAVAGGEIEGGPADDDEAALGAALMGGMPE